MCVPLITFMLTPWFIRVTIRITLLHCYTAKATQHWQIHMINYLRIHNFAWQKITMYHILMCGSRSLHAFTYFQASRYDSTLVWIGTYTVHRQQTVELLHILMHISLFYKLRHPLPHDPISNTTLSVISACNCLHSNYAVCSKRSKVACLVNKTKLVCWWISWPLRLNDDDGCIV